MIKKLSFSRVNSGLLLLIVLINSYVFIAPLVPALIFHWQINSGKEKILSREVQTVASGSALPVNKNQANQVIIPSMVLKQPILEGPVANEYKTLNKGIWLWPKGSTPDKGSNTILVGHRFTYTNPMGVFYFLNKIKIGDNIVVYWSGQSYLYRVNSISEVSPRDIQIENPSSQPELTLFTCTPVWLPKDRLVIVAGLVHKS